MGGEGAVKLSLRFNWPNVSKASGVASSCWFIGKCLCGQFEQISLNLFTHEVLEKPV